MNSILSELLRTKAHIGKSQWNREIAEYIVGFRNDQSIDLKARGVKLSRPRYAIFDLEKTCIALTKVLFFLKNLVRGGTAKPHILLVTKLLETQLQVSKPIFSVIQDKWIGGMLTNWKQISESILIYSQFRAKYGHFDAIHFPVYQKYQKRFQGIQNVHLPDILIVTHPKEYEIAILEANHLKIPVIAFVDTDIDPKILSKIDYIIPGNTKSPEFLLFCLNLFCTHQNT